MTLVKHLVEMHGGTVSARTDADGVAEFEVRLPAIRAAVAARRKSAQPSPAESAEPTIVPQRILIADDNADSAESMGMLLRLMGNDVRIASDGLEAVEQAAAFQPDIVLMDIGMPRLDGYEAARRIRNQDWSRDTLLVAVTGWGAERRQRRSNGGRVRPPLHEAARSRGAAPARQRHATALSRAQPSIIAERRKTRSAFRKRGRGRGRRLRRARNARSNRSRRRLARRGR